MKAFMGVLEVRVIVLRVKACLVNGKSWGEKVHVVVGEVVNPVSCMRMEDEGRRTVRLFENWSERDI